MCVSAQHPVFILPDGAAECVRALPVWGGQRDLVSGTGLLVRHRDWRQHAAVQVHYLRHKPSWWDMVHPVLQGDLLVRSPQNTDTANKNN